MVAQLNPRATVAPQQRLVAPLQPRAPDHVVALVFTSFLIVAAIEFLGRNTAEVPDDVGREGVLRIDTPDLLDDLCGWVLLGVCS